MSGSRKAKGEYTLLTLGGIEIAKLAVPAGESLVTKLNGGYVAVQWICHLYTYVTENWNVSQIFGCTGTKYFSFENMIALKRLTFSLACMWYIAVVTDLTPSSSKSVTSTLDVC